MAAWEALNDRSLSLRADDVLKLCLEAGYTEDAAQRAATAQANSRLDQGLPP